MSVITTWEAVPNRLEQFWLYLVDEAPKGVPASEIAHRFSPPSLGRADGDESDEKAGGNIFTAVLQESQALGFVVRREEGDSILPLLPPTDRKTPQQKSRWFRDQLRRLLTTPDESKKFGQDDVPLALAWLALQSPLHPMIFGETRSVVIMSAFPGNENVFRLNAQASQAQCYYWARYLGLCTFSTQQVRKEGRKSSTRIIVPDPTVVIRSLLSEIFERETELTASAFLDRLGSLCPVLERGEARKIVMSQATRPEDYPGEDELSIGTSLAMLRLEAENSIKLDDRADALKPCMITMGAHKERFSHVRWEGGAHGVA